MMTVGAPGGKMCPVGLGIGATQLLNATRSPTRAAGRPSIMTVAEPMAIAPGPAGMHGGTIHGVVMEPMTAAGCLAIRTVGTQLSVIGNGIGGCGTGVGTGAGGWIGAWQCGASWSVWSPIRAAGGIAIS